MPVISQTRHASPFPAPSSPASKTRTPPRRPWHACCTSISFPVNRLKAALSGPGSAQAGSRAVWTQEGYFWTRWDKLVSQLMASGFQRKWWGRPGAIGGDSCQTLMPHVK